MHGRSRSGYFARQAVAPLTALVLSALVLAPAPAAGAATNGEGPLSTELEALATPAIAALPVPAQAEAVGLPAEGPGSLSREGARVVVEARADADRFEALRAAGAKVLTARDGIVALSVDPDDLESLAAVPGVAAVAPALRPVVYDVGGEPVAAATAGAETCEGGSVISQGVAQLNVPAARTAFGARGAGVTVGVISDSFNSATSGIEGTPLATRASGDETSNDLPGAANTCTGQGVPVDVIAEAPRSATSEATDEGRAMLQVVHDVAPHAKLAFATALSSEVEFARNIERLAEPVAAGGAGAQVIVDDIGYLSEPFFQDGPVAVAIRKVTQSGVTYLTAAGNENLRDVLRRNIGSWEASAYRPMACPSYVNTFLGGTSTGCMSFSPVGKDPEFGIEVAAGGTAQIDLQWAEPWGGVKTDIDAYLFNEKQEVVSNYKEGGGTLDNVELQKPIEVLRWANTTGKAERVFLVLNRCSGTCNPLASTTGTPRVKFEFVGHGGGVTGIEYPVSAGGDVVGPTIYGHAGAAAAVSVGAVRYSESSTAPREPEYYSSRGPVTHYFGPVTGTTAASTLSSPEVVAKPDLTATDCASTTFFARLSEGAYRFCGTSEAAPHAAAVAALMKQTSPLASPAAILAAMKSSATAYTPATTTNSAEAVGAGLLNAAGAMSALGGSPVDDPPSTVLTSSTGSGSVTIGGPLTNEPVAAAPTVELTRKPARLTGEARPTFDFRASESVTFSCQIDGGAARSCSSPYRMPNALGDGAHSFLVTGVDGAGRSGSSGAYAFTVDTKAPTTTFAKKPKKLLWTSGRSAVGRFALRASESPATFYCQIDKAPARVCPASFSRRFGEGAHVVRVKARDAVGNLAKGWTAYRFGVKQARPARHRSPRSHRSA